MTTALDLFAGPGGWSLACADLGIDELGVDWDTAACATAAAAGHRRICGDVRHYGASGHFDGLIASPPCQTFSSAGIGSGRYALDRILAAVPLVAQGAAPARAIGTSYSAPDPDGVLFDDVLPVVDDARTTLVLEPLRFILDLAPTWVALEQVPQVLPVWQAYAHELGALGYHVAVGVLSAEQYGVPQTRRRAILLAHRDRPVALPRPTHSRFYRDDPARLDPGVQPWLSMSDALGWGMTRRPYVTVATGTAAGGTDPQVLGGSEARAAVRRELEAGRWVPGSAVRYVGSAYPNATVRHAHHPAPAVAFAHAAKDVRWVADRDEVRVGIADAAVLQGFPADYPWQGTLSQRYQQVGDAIPPPLAAAILRGLL